MPLIVGLGNPGKEYADTPHSIGFEVILELARRADVKFRRGPVPNCEEARLSGPRPVILLRPLSFMNRSGGPVSAALRWHDLTLDDLMVVCDDVNLPLAHIRLRSQGGAGGQKGLLSVIENVRSEQFARLRIGVGGGHPGADVAHHVLGKFGADVRPLIRSAVEQAADALECYITYGLAEAMNRYNTQRQSISEPPSGTGPAPDTQRPEGDQ
jgi:PTH1 family peptidyl-tRNA hydrolase